MFAFQLTNLLDNALMSMHTTNILLFLPSSGRPLRICNWDSLKRTKKITSNFLPGEHAYTI